MEIILRTPIEKLGHVGDIVKVRNGYARNYLLPRKLAYLATPGNVKVMEQGKSKLLRREAELRAEAEKLRDRLSAIEVVIERRVGEQKALYGSVTSSDIAENLEGQGFTIDKRKILLSDHIKQIGEFSIPIRLFTEVTAEVKLRVVPEGSSAGAPETPAEQPAEASSVGEAVEEAESDAS
jgi:large subunit ribosomal protein L9